MAKRQGPKKVHRYSAEFKVTAVKLSQLSGVRVQDVAQELDIHPFMLSRWRKEYREGALVAPAGKVHIDPKTTAELRRLRELERDHKRLLMEHDLLKKAIRFCSERKQRSSRSSKSNGGATR
jgi:transposase